MKVVVPPYEPCVVHGDEVPWPTLGPWVCRFIEERFVYGPGSMQHQQVTLDEDQQEFLWRAYEHYPQGYTIGGQDMSGKRRFDRCALSVRKGSAKTEMLAWVVAMELHPEGPVRFAGWDPLAPGGMATGRAVTDPYIPMLAYTKDQVSELGYGALMSILQNCPDAGLFDVQKDRTLRLNKYGKRDGIAVPLAGTPGALDGARTTFQALDETHRLHLPNHKAAVETMLNNLPKRPLESPWQMSTTTAGEPGQDSVAEDEFKEGMANHRGTKKSQRFFFMHRQASDGHKFDTIEQRIAAIREATGPGVARWTDFFSIAAQWDREGADTQYLERVWTNRWTQTAAQAFDKEEFAALGDPSLVIPKGAFITLGFDGAVFEDSTAIVATDIFTGTQQVLGLWEKPDDLPIGPDGKPQRWRVPESEVDEVFRNAMKDYEVWRLYGDPPHWKELMAKWAGEYPDEVVEFWTKNQTPMYYAIKNYQHGIKSGDVSFDGDKKFVEHIGNAGKRLTRGVDEDDQPKFILAKIEANRKYDVAVAAILSWEARMDAIEENAQPKEQDYVPFRAR
jgi:phage terminase large subunit-like protein